MLMGDSSLGVSNSEQQPGQNQMSGASSYYNNIMNNRGLTSSPMKTAKKAGGQ